VVENQGLRLQKSPLSDQQIWCVVTSPHFVLKKLQVADLAYVAVRNGFVLCCVRHRCIYPIYCRLPRPRSLSTDLAFDALKQALYARRDTKLLIHHSDQLLSGIYPYAIRKGYARQR